MATLDSTTQASWLGAPTDSAKALTVVGALTEPVAVEIRNGAGTLMGSGTMASPWASATGATVVIGEVTGALIEVLEAGTPDGAWYLLFKGANGRTMRCGFGLSTSNAELKWSLGVWQVGDKASIGTATIGTAVQLNGSLTLTAANVDATTATNLSAAAVVAAFTGTVTVDVYDGTNTSRANGTMAAPWATASGDTITVGEVDASGLLVTLGGVPDNNWYVQFRAGSRTVRGTFGVLGSGRDFVWSLASFQTGSRGTLGTVALAASGTQSPQVVILPAISGATQVGQTLTCSTGTWDGFQPIEYQYQWRRNGTNISGATTSTYVAQSADLSASITCAVTATNVAGQGVAVSNAVVIAAAGDPTGLPLLQQSDFAYVGSFKVPHTEATRYDAGRALGMSPTPGRMYFSGNPAAAHQMAEMTIPALVNLNNVSGNKTTKIAALNEATINQSLTTGDNGAFGSELRFEGALAYNGRLILSAAIAYEAQGYTPGPNEVISHLARPLTLTNTSGIQTAIVRGAASGTYSQRRFFSGYMCHVPTEWQALLGGPAITGFVAQSIVSKASDGPSAMVFNPDDINGASVVLGTPLLCYPGGAHPLDGGNPDDPAIYNGYFPRWNWTGTVAGCGIIPGTRTLAFVGKSGHGRFIYGAYTNNPALHGTFNSVGFPYAYDPTDTSNGEHAYPYRHQIWLYDLNDLVRVKNGEIQPHEVEPYAWWPIVLPLEGNYQYDALTNIPFPDPDPDFHIINGATFDPSNNRIYLTGLHPGTTLHPIYHALQATVP
jgi:hypothetical protein